MKSITNECPGLKAGAVECVCVCVNCQGSQRNIYIYIYISRSGPTNLRYFKRTGGQVGLVWGLGFVCCCFFWGAGGWGPRLFSFEAEKRIPLGGLKMHPWGSSILRTLEVSQHLAEAGGPEVFLPGSFCRMFQASMSAIANRRFLGDSHGDKRPYRCSSCLVLASLPVGDCSTQIQATTPQPLKPCSGLVWACLEGSITRQAIKQQITSMAFCLA